MRASIVLKIAVYGFAVCLQAAAVGAAYRASDNTSSPAPSAPRYSAKGELLFPSQYREWIYLSSGLDMSYSPRVASGNGSSQAIFDNVFVNPEAYRSFVSTGMWPDKTVMVLEIRSGESSGSINKGGHYQGGAVRDIEVHVKDQSRFPGGWAFFGFDNQVSGKLFPPSANCYKCHAEHGAVDTTFVQFYPTLMPIAEKKGTLSQAYRQELKSGAASPSASSK